MMLLKLYNMATITAVITETDIDGTLDQGQITATITTEVEGEIA
jgi:hypothetical protein